MATDDPWSQALDWLNYTDPALSFARNLYVAPPESLTRGVADRVLAERAAQIVLLGGIGTGKTTDMLAAQQILRADDRFAPHYVEVSQYVRLSTPRAGVLVALAALARLHALRAAGVTIPASVRTSIARLHAGLQTPMDGDLGLIDRDLYAGTPDALDLPVANVADLAHIFEELGRLSRTVAGRSVVLLLDGLDRVESVASLNDFIKEDMPALRALGVSVVLNGSIAWRFRLDGALQAPPEVVQWRRVPDPGVEPEREFLTRVLQARTPPGLCDTAAVDLVVQGTGGVLRDLLAVTRTAIIHARHASRNRVEIEDAHAALAALAERRLLFLSPERLAVIRSVDAHRTVDGHLRALEDLLASCDVLVRSLPDKYVVHPAVSAALDLREVA